jgi:hypothetical protein
MSPAGEVGAEVLFRESGAERVGTGYQELARPVRE